MDSQASPTEESKPLTLTQSRDLYSYYRIAPTRPLTAELKGMVGDMIDRGGVVIIRLIDATGQIRIEFQKTDFQSHLWKQVGAIKKLDRINVKGRVLIKDDKPVVSAQTFKIFLRKDEGPSKVSDFDQDVLATQFLLARVKSRAIAHFQSMNFEEFEPSVLSFSRGKTEIEPLGVVFSGYGAPAYLIPSPAAQLREALIVAPSEKVFCVSRCFSASIRDGYTSAESLILCASKLNATIGEMATLAEEAIKRIFSHFTTMPQVVKQAWLGSTVWPRKEYKALTTDPQVSSPEIHVQKTDKVPLQAILRICWPPTFIAAEGHIESLKEDISIGGVTIHLERMIPILRQVILRRLRHLGTTADLK